MIHEAPRPHGSISRNLLLGLLVAILVAGGAALFFGYQGFTSVYRSELRQEQTVYLRQMTEILANPLNRQDVRRVESLCILFADEPHVSHLRLENSDGELVFASSAPTGLATTVARQQHIVAENRAIGVLTVYFMPENTVLSMALFSYYVMPLLLFCAAMCAVCFFLVRRFVETPLLSLTRSIDAVSGVEQFSIKNTDTPAELFPLARLFEQLTDEVLLRESELQHQTETASALKQAEDALREELRELREGRTLLENAATDGFWNWDAAEEKLTLSRAWKAMLGYAEDELPDTLHTWFSLIAPENSLEARELITECLEGRRDSIECVYSVRHKNGGWRSILLRGASLRNADGVVTRVAGIHADRSARKNAVERHWRIRKALTAVLDALPCGVALLDADGIVRHWSSGAAFLCGISRSEATGSSYSSLLPECGAFITYMLLENPALSALPPHMTDAGSVSFFRRVWIQRGAHARCLTVSAIPFPFMSERGAVVFLLPADEENAAEKALMTLTGLPEKEEGRRPVSVHKLFAECSGLLRRDMCTATENDSSLCIEEDLPPDLPELVCAARETAFALYLLAKRALTENRTARGTEAGGTLRVTARLESAPIRSDMLETADGAKRIGACAGGYSGAEWIRMEVYTVGMADAEAAEAEQKNYAGLPDVFTAARIIEKRHPGRLVALPGRGAAIRGFAVFLPVFRG